MQVEPTAKEGQVDRNFFRQRSQAIEVEVPTVTTDDGRRPLLQLAEPIEMEFS